MIKETYNLTSYPTFILLKDGLAYEYEGYRTQESFKAFIEKDYAFIKKQYDIPPVINWFGLQKIYFNRN